MSTLTETAYAKINLVLHVRARRGDGYHDLETLFAFVDAGDELTATNADDVKLSISGPFSHDVECNDSNLVMQTANLMHHHFRVQEGASLTLQKNLPVSSGIGGGSADAAAAARLLNKLWRLDASDTELAELLAPLGADIPACVASRTVIGSGTGTDLRPVEGSDFAGIPVLLVNPLEPVATSAVFKNWNGIDKGAQGGNDLVATMLEGRNDLEPMAIAICPAISEILEALNRTSPRVARMSGSGATCFALYETIDDRDQAEKCVNPAWWKLAGKIR